LQEEEIYKKQRQKKLKKLNSEENKKQNGEEVACEIVVQVFQNKEILV
jgi:hypothetical protein